MGAPDYDAGFVNRACICVKTPSSLCFFQHPDYSVILHFSLSPDGRYLVFSDEKGEIFVVEVGGTRQPERSTYDRQTLDALEVGYVADSCVCIKTAAGLHTIWHPFYMPIQHWALSPDGECLAFSDVRGNIYIGGTGAGCLPVQSLMGDGRPIVDLAWDGVHSVDYTVVGEGVARLTLA